MHTHSESADARSDDEEIVSSVACRLLEVDRATLLRWVAAGEVKPTRKLPGRTGAFLFSRNTIEQLAADRTKAGA